MSWTTPPTFVSGTVVTASNLNILSSDLSFLKVGYDGAAFSGVKLSRGTHQTITNATWNAATFTTETFDVGGWWTSGSAITVPASAVPTGYSTVAVMVTATCYFASNTTGLRYIRTMLSGVEQDRTLIGGVSGDVTVVPTLISWIPATSGAVITVELYQNSGASLDAQAINVSAVRFAAIS